MLPADLLAAVRQAVAADEGGRFRCPLSGHGKGLGDRNPSAIARLDVGQDGREFVAVHCYADCDDKQLWAAVVKGHLPERQRVDWRVAREFRHPDGSVAQSLRFDWGGGYGCPARVRKGKQLVDCDNPGIHKHMLPGRDGRPVSARSLNLVGLLVSVEWPEGADESADRAIILCEGEKAADSVLAAGFPAACWYGGTGKVQHADWSPLSGRKVILWPDDDLTGRRAMNRAAAHIVAAGGEVSGIVKTEGRTGDDAADLPNASVIADVIAGAVPFEPPDPEEAGVDESPHTPVYAAGVWYAQKHMAGKWLYDPLLIAWYWYDGHVWHDLPDPETMIRDGIARCRKALAAEAMSDGVPRANIFLSNAWQNRKSPPADFGSALRNTLRGALPVPPPYLLNTPDGQLDLRQEKPCIEPSDPRAGHRSMTAGRYRPDEPALTQIIEERLEIVLSEPAIEQYFQLAALTISGRAQSFRSIMMLTGASGSGKGGCIRLLEHTLGTYSATATPQWLDGKIGDIDAKAAEILHRQPKMISIDELGSDTKVAKSRLNALSGDNTWTARKPYQTIPYTGKVPSAIWTTAVAPPTLDTGDGIARRLAVLPTLDKELSPEVRRKDAISQDLSDALLTVIVGIAYHCYQPGYVPPEGVSEARQEVLDEMDPLQSWLNGLDDSFEGKPMTDLLKTAHEEVGDWVSQTHLGRSVQQSPRWRKKRDSRQGNRVMRLLLRRQAILLPLDEPGNGA